MPARLGPRVEGVYKKCRPSGRKLGRIWMLPVLDPSDVSGRGWPGPRADTRASAVSGPRKPLKTISSSRLHVPGGPSIAFEIVTTGPPAASIRRSFPEAMKAIERLSGDQNGADARAVPASGCAVSLSRRRTHSIVLPEVSGATKASCRPSGDTLKRSAGATVSAEGGTIDSFAGGASGVVLEDTP